MQNFINSLIDKEIPTSERSGIPTLQPTARNILRNELHDKLYDHFADIFNDSDSINVHRVKAGVAFEIANEPIMKEIEESNGMVTFILSAEFKDLEYDAYNDSLDYEEELEIKQKRKKQ